MCLDANAQPRVPPGLRVAPTEAAPAYQPDGKGRRITVSAPLAAMNFPVSRAFIRRLTISREQPAGLVLREGLYATRQDDEERVVAIALFDEQHALAEAPRHAARGERAPSRRQRHIGGVFLWTVHGAA